MPGDCGCTARPSSPSDFGDNHDLRLTPKSRTIRVRRTAFSHCANTPAMTSTWISRTLAALRSAGGRVTDQRRLILAEIDAAPAGMSAEELVTAVRRSDGDASRSTVYRTLDLLRDIDAVETVHPSPEQHRYLARRTPDQHHVVCEQCSSVALIDSCTFDTTTTTEIERRTGFAITGHVLEVFGLCGACHSSAT